MASTTLAWRTPAHPHVRGDDAVRRVSRCASRGSPPRAWGRLGDGHLHLRGRRLTPTCVGTTGAAPTAAPGWSAHPHVRGDDVARPHKATVDYGSPPRAWGRRRPPRRAAGRGRLTPTCVGTTRARIGWPRRTAAHPHVRGDDASAWDCLMLKSGSPPRAWGRRHGGFYPGLRDRLTPTCVGTTRGSGGWPRR